MATVTSPILTDATFATKMDALAAAVKPDASDIPLTPPSGMTATNVQDGFSEIKQSLSYYKDYTVTLSANSYVSPFTHLGTKNINGNLDGHTNYKIISVLLLGGSSTQMGTVVYKGEGTSGDYINVYGNAAISMTIRVNYILT